MESLQDADRALGSVVFPFTEREFIAGFRAGRMARDRGYDSVVRRLGVAVLSYVVLFGGSQPVIGWLLGGKGFDDPKFLASELMVTGTAVIAALVLYVKIHGYRRRLKARYLKSPYRGEKMHYQFTPLRLVSENRLQQQSVEWSALRRVLEFQDGFLMDWGLGYTDWIPKHVLNDAFDSDDLAQLFREKVQKYVVIKRVAGLPE